MNRQRTLLEIDLLQLQKNYRILSELFQVPIMAIVKANAYGHGDKRCAKALWEAGCRSFGAASLEEAVRIRKECPLAEVQILGWTSPGRIKSLLDHRLTQTLYSPAYAQALASVIPDGECLPVCAALDTGMNRLGFSADARETESLCKLFTDPKFSVHSLETHLASADDVLSDSGTWSQAEKLDLVQKRLWKRGIRIPDVRICNSAAALRFPTLRRDAVRIGLLLWGISPICGLPQGVAPVATWKTRIIHIHTIREGEKIGYGGFLPSPDVKSVATLSLGYADGFSQCYRNATLTVCTRQGKFQTPILGKICMDQMMIDVTNIPAEVNDTVLLPPAATLSALSGKIPYEVLCNVSSRVKRVYKK